MPARDVCLHVALRFCFRYFEHRDPAWCFRKKDILSIRNCRADFPVLFFQFHGAHNIQFWYTYLHFIEFSAVNVGGQKKVHTWWLDGDLPWLKRNLKTHTSYNLIEKLMQNRLGSISSCIFGYHVGIFSFVNKRFGYVFRFKKCSQFLVNHLRLSWNICLVTILVGW